MKLLALAVLVAIFQAMPGASERPGAADPPRPAVVRMDAIAVDAQGRPVRDLGPGDFEIVEEGTLRPIENVRFVAVDDTPPAADSVRLPIETREEEHTEAARDGSRLFAIFLDEYHVSPGPGVARVRAALTEFVDRELGPRDLVLIVKPLDSLPNLMVTRDHQAIKEAIATFEGRKGDYTPRTEFEEDYIPTMQARADQVRAQIVISSLNAIAVHLGTLRSGRKTIVVVSEGFGRGVPRRRTDPVGLPTLETVVRSANRSGASIYPILPSALAADDPAVAGDAGASTEPLETLRSLAQGTDGHAILSNSDLQSGLAAIRSDSSGYYVLAFQPVYQKETGRFHPVTVTVMRTGVTLRTRTGYWEPVPDAAAALRSLEPVLPPMARRVSPLIRPWFGFTRGDGEKTRVQFVWEPATRVPGDRTQSGAPARVRLNVLTADGTNAFEGVVGTSALPATGDLEREPLEVAFDVAPGRLYLRMQIEDETGKLIDTDVRDLLVGPVAGPLAFGTVGVLRARTAVEFRALKNDPAAVPVTARQFSRTDTLLIRVPVYASTGTPNVTVKLASSKGNAMRELSVTTLPDSNVRQVELPLAGLAPTDYRLQFFATTGNATVTDTLAFRVTP